VGAVRVCEPKHFAPSDLYIIEIQSGDVIEVYADGFNLARLDDA
jgi:hypothetical protein